MFNSHKSSSQNDYKVEADPAGYSLELHINSKFRTCDFRIRSPTPYLHRFYWSKNNHARLRILCSKIICVNLDYDSY
jgi:hypothetical protein